MATVMMLPVQPRVDEADGGSVPRAGQPTVRQIKPADSPDMASPLRSRRPVAAPAARHHRPRAVACGQSYAPDLHGARLTTRGKLVVALLWVVMAAAILMMLSRPGEVPAPAETTTVVIEPGDTLWRLAEGLAPGADRRVTISQIVELNGLRSAGDIRPGDVLVVPTGG